METLTPDDWRQASFLVVARLDITVDALEDRCFTVGLDEVHGEHAAVVGIPTGLVLCLVATPGASAGGFVVLCGDPGTCPGKRRWTSS